MESTSNKNLFMEGRIKQQAFETVGRRESWAEQRIATVNIVGTKDKVAGKVKPGDNANVIDEATGGFNSDYFIRTVEESCDDGVTYNATLTLVKCPDGKTEPYAISWEASMEEVQTPLINHPMLRKEGIIDQLYKWEDTSPGRRIGNDKEGNLIFYYDETEYSGTQITLNRKKITNEWNIAYCKAILGGIKTFNRYLPVITKTSTYLELKGIRYDDDRIPQRGNIEDFSGPDTIGHFDDPDIKIEGYKSGKDGVWFKSMDRYVINADGTATRTESWVFTNDTSANWIYTNQLD